MKNTISVLFQESLSQFHCNTKLNKQNIKIGGGGGVDYHVYYYNLEYEIHLDFPLFEGPFVDDFL